MALASFILIALAASVLVVTCAASNIKTTSSASSSSYSYASSESRSSSSRRKCIKGNKCPKNEEFSKCIQCIGRAQFCSQKGQTLRQEDTSTCTKGCVCKEKFLRSYNGTCIPECQCNTDCGPDEVQDDCPVDCPSDYCPVSDERSLNCPRPDPDDCPPAVCKCGFNRRRAENGTCILTRDCPPVDCSARPFEEYVACPPLCPTDDCSQASESGECPAQFGNILIILPCNPTCRCIKGYWRKNGICVPYNECKIPSSCPANEEVRCVNECPPETTCNTRGIAYRCMAPDRPCEHKCVCKKGYFRNYLGTCITNDECDKCTGDNEFFACDSACDNNCSSIYNRTNCPIKTFVCVPQCFCEDGFARDKDGNCVPVEECPKLPSCPANEEVRCMDKCPPELTCKTRGRVYKCAPPVDPCENKCVCKKGYFRNAQGTCIPEDECDIPTSCPANEEVRCVDKCPPERTCRTRDLQYRCMAPVDPCQNKCVCKEGYYRNFLGTCISTDECDQCPGDNEFFACDSACDNECSTMKTQNRTNCPIQNIVCNRRCYCEDGFARDKDGNCVPVEDCPILPSCRTNEEVRCMNKCPPELTCKTRGRVYKCAPPVDPCEYKCVCKEGYFKNSQGTCIPEDKCDIPESCPANEEVRCVNKCPPERSCDTRGIQVKCAAPVDPCQNKCVCKKGYYRNYLGTCISNAECDKCTGDNEFFACDSACDNECTKIHKQNRTNCPIQNIVCNRWCYCKDGFARDKDRNCVPVKECPANTCPKNEEYVPCIQGVCRAMNCSQKDEPVPCPDRKWPEEVCDAGCICKENYLRNEDGICVPEDQCETLPEPTCGDNEVLDKCPSDCPSDYCPKCATDNRKCPQPSSCPPPKCKCRFNFRRSVNGTCIPTRSCPPFDCSAKPNEQWTPCPPLCPSDECSLPRVKGVCPYKIGIVLECNPKCQCKEGFGRVNGKCIPYEDCPDLCPVNEEYNSCTQAVCRNQNCTDKDGPVFCPRIDPRYCIKGCVCKENFYRNSNGTCVEYDDCDAPPEPTCGENEFLDKCPSDCPSDYCPKCEEDNEECPQPDPCPAPACKCAFNFRRSANGTCIPTEDCPPFDCSHLPNEEWKACPPLCPTDDCSINRVRGTCPWRTLIRIRLECNPRCQCKDGYGRINGTCVPFEQCPDLCPSNEEYNSCTQALCRPQNCANRYKPQPCPMVESSSCKRDCVCKQDYFRNDNGTCVTDDECIDKQCPNPNEKYAMSRQPKCPDLGTCMSIVARIRCDKPESLGCICKSGYLRDDKTSECIPICMCPQMASALECQKNDTDKKCPNPNEIYAKSQQPKCPDLGTCKSLVARIPCDKPESFGCICKSGYLRDDKTSECIPICKCPQMASALECQKNDTDKKCPNPNEIYAKSQQPKCPDLGTCKSLVARIPCDKPESFGCICKSGYLRDDKTSKCIPICKCPQMASALECKKNDTDKKCPNLNEIYAKSQQPKCPDLGTCKSLVARIPCDKPESFGCICKNGYLRDDKTSECNVRVPPNGFSDTMSKQ